VGAEGDRSCLSMKKGRRGLTSLEHEALDDAVEDDAVEVVVLRVRAEVLHRLPTGCEHLVRTAGDDRL